MGWRYQDHDPHISEGALTKAVPTKGDPDCEFCHGTGKIQLIFKSVDCECVTNRDRLKYAHSKEIPKKEAEPTKKIVDAYQNTNINLSGTSAGPHLIPLSWIVTSDYQANRGERVPYNPSGGTFTIYAPEAPSIGDFFAIKNVTNDCTAITLDGNGYSIEGPGMSFMAVTQVIGSGGIALDWQFFGNGWGWRIV